MLARCAGVRGPPHRSARACRRRAARRWRARCRPCCRSAIEREPQRVVAGHAAEGRLRRGRDVDRDTRGPCGLSAAFSVSSTTPGSTTAARALPRRARRTRCRYLLPSITSASPTVWPHCEVPAPRGRIGDALLAAICIARDGDVAVARHDHADRLDLVDRRVGGVAARGRRVEQDLAVDLAASRAASAGRERSWVALLTGRGPRGRGCGIMHAPPTHRADRQETPMPAGRHFLQIPGPTNVPDRVLRAIDHADDRSSRPGVQRAGPEGARRHASGLQDRRARSSSIRRPAPAPGRRRSSTRCRPATRC